MKKLFSLAAVVMALAGVSAGQDGSTTPLPLHVTSMQQADVPASNGVAIRYTVQASADRGGATVILELACTSFWWDRSLPTRPFDLDMVCPVLQAGQDYPRAELLGGDRINFRRHFKLSEWAAAMPFYTILSQREVKRTRK